MSPQLQPTTTMAHNLQPANTLREFLTLSSPKPWTFTTTTLPWVVPGGRAYGGCTLALAVTAATSTVPDSHRIFSALGNFLNGAKGDREMTANVKEIRSTRVFSTRFVEVSQQMDNGDHRVCMTVLVDFQLPDTSPRDGTFEYSERPSKEYSAPAAGAPGKDFFDPKAPSTFMTRTMEQRHCPEGVMGQAVAEKRAKTTQDALPMPEKTSASWFRSKIPLTTHCQQAGMMAFLMDGPTSYLPLVHGKRNAKQFEAVASLDFALRFFGSELPSVADGEKAEEWWLREVKTTNAAQGMTYFEGKLFDESGRCMVSMTQQDIARPKKKGTSKL